VTDRGTHREIVYRQEVETDKPVSGYSLRVLRKSMGEFAQDLDDYLRRSDLVRDEGEAPPPDWVPQRERAAKQPVADSREAPGRHAS
jgi:hypothetical protein